MTWRCVEGLTARRYETTERISASQRKGTIPARRFGETSELGALCAFLCSVHAGFITGQSLLIDGGAYPGTF